MNVAGQLDVLTPDQMQTVHDMACKILAEKGVAFESDATIATFKEHGFAVDDHIVRFDKAAIEKCVAQTPQAFRTDLIVACMNRARQEGFTATDDSALAEKYGNVKVKAVMGSYENIKITTPEDL